MKSLSNATAVSLLALSAALMRPDSALAGCSQGVYSDPNSNTCIGSYSLHSNTGLFNTATGGYTLYYNTTGESNTATGASALFNNTTGTNNTAIGATALLANTSGSSNTASGSGALGYNKTGEFNTATGTNSLLSNTSGDSNSATGNYALAGNTTGNTNTANGSYALAGNTTGNYNTSSGSMALSSNTVGNLNVAMGFLAGGDQTTGSSNTAIGSYAGLRWTTGSHNIAIANFGAVGEANTIRIGVQGRQKRTFIAGIRGTGIVGQSVVVNLKGQLGVVSSSRRYKQDIQPMGDASDSLLKLRPVTFHYKQAEDDGSRPLQYGLIAEEVAEAMPELAIYNAEGQPESVAYQALPSLLLNEYQKQSKQLEATVARLDSTRKELNAATTELDATRVQLADSQARLDAVEAEMKQIKLMLGRLASAQSSGTQLAAAP